MSQSIRVLLIEDSEDDAELLLLAMKAGGYEPIVERVDTAAAMRAALGKQAWDLVLSDHSMPQFSGPAALALLQESGLDLPFIIVSGAIGEETAVAAMKAGAHDYVMKGNLARLLPAIERELREAAGRRERRRAEEALRRSEEQLRQAQKMEVLGRLAGGIAHDFNNLLMVILGCAEILEIHLGDTNPLSEHATEIHKAVDRGASLIRQLLAFSRRQVLQTRVLDLNAVIANMEEMLRRLIGKTIELCTILHPALDYVNADPGQLEQVIMNLAVNASDAMPEGGSLTLETANVELGEAYTPQHGKVTPGCYVRLAVHDIGMGMDPATQAHLFEPFFTTKEPGRGTGLGLATVYGIVQQSGGCIDVESAPGCGATFTIYLPRVEARWHGEQAQQCLLPASSQS